MKEIAVFERLIELLDARSQGCEVTLHANELAELIVEAVSNVQGVPNPRRPARVTAQWE